MSDNSANLLQRVKIDGVEYELKGKVDFSQLTITKVGGTTEPTEPPVVVEPGEVDPTTGTIKEGSKWSKNPGDASTWQVVEMGDSDKQGLWKIIAADKLNVIADLPSKEIGLQLIEYFKTHKFPPEEGTTTQPPIEPTEPTEPPVVTPGGKGVTKDGVQLLFADGSTVKEGYNENFRDDGKRFDNNVGNWVASEATGYFKFTKDPVDDEVSIKWSEKSHSGNNDVQCYDTGVSIKDGKVRMRFEQPHPNYSGNIGSGQGAPLGTKWIGYKGVKIPQADGSVLIELYQDTGDNETKPSNQWKKIYSHVDTKYKRTGAHPYVTIRVDDPGKNGQKNLEAKWISVARIA